MPSATITSATMASSSVKPELLRRLAPIETFFLHFELAVDRARELESAVATLARNLERERSDFAAREQHDLRHRLLELHVLEVARQLDLSSVEHQSHRQLRVQLVELQQPVIERL